MLNISGIAAELPLAFPEAWITATGSLLQRRCRSYSVSTYTPNVLCPLAQVTLKSKEIARLPEFVVDTSRETLAALIQMETACKGVMRRPAVLEVTIGDANDLAICFCYTFIVRWWVHPRPPHNAAKMSLARSYEHQMGSDIAGGGVRVEMEFSVVALRFITRGVRTASAKVPATLAHRCCFGVCVGWGLRSQHPCAQVKKAQTQRELLQSMINAVSKLSE